MPTDRRPAQLDLFAAAGAGLSEAPSAAGPNAAAGTGREAGPETAPEAPAPAGVDPPVAEPPLPDAPARAFATDPANHVVLEASAGTGKTTVLVRRYLALLAAGVDPRNILAITFTRKAAAEMRERIVRDLRAAAATSAEGRQRWLHLRDRLSDVAISTIDAFCLALLREFPLEADLDPSFEVADETEVARLVEDALDEALRITRAQAGQDEDVALLFSQLSTPRARQGLRHLLDRRHVAPAALRRYLDGLPETTATEAVGRAMRGALEALDALPGGLEAFLRDGPVERAAFRLLAADLRALRADAWPGAGSLRAVLDELRDLFLTREGRPRRRPGSVRADFPTRDAWGSHSRAIESAGPQVARVLADLDRDLNAALARGVWRVFHIALDRYRRSLAAHDVVDFSDALERAVRLLEQMDEFAQSRYRLESRYHHVLVDELQDTSRLQWRLVSLLVQSWGEGHGLVHEAPLPPSIFVVGDRKQSIYRFRDAEVAVLDEAARFIGGLREHGSPRRSITHSFRARPELLTFVNDLFDEVERLPGRSDAFRYGDGDRFPATAAAAGAVRDPDPALGLVAAPDSASAARAIAGEVKRLLREGVVRDPQTGVRRTARPGDVAVLFRTRESHREIEAALEAEGVPTYVYKGLGFFEADEIKDLAALLRYLAVPGSRARAAAFLRSRLVRLSDRGLRLLGRQLSSALVSAELPDAWDQLDPDDRRVLELVRASVPRWLALVDRVPPAEVLDAALDESGYALELEGPRRAQAEENVKKLRALVRRIQNRGYATLDRIAAHLERLSAGDESNAVIDAVDAVNLMTVHAAKGLEFPVVFVAHLGRGSGTTAPPVRVVADAGHGEPAVTIGGLKSDADEEERVRDREETKRLVYVALTRARDRLYLSAVTPGGALKPARGSLGEVLPPSVRDLFAQAAAGSATVEWEGTSGCRHTLRACRPPDPAVAPAAERPAPTEPAETVTPAFDVGWRQTTVSALVHPAPERVFLEAAGQTDTATGRLVHRLFQAAPPLDAPVDDLKTLARHLARRPGASGGDEADSVDAAVSTFLGLRRTAGLEAWLSAGRARYEVPFTLRLEASRTLVRGTMDCLVFPSPGEAVVFEIKTGRPAAWHHAQLDLYVAAARELFPDLTISGRLVYPQGSERDA